MAALTDEELSKKLDKAYELGINLVAAIEQARNKD
jgi:hypothetical protein